MGEFPGFPSNGYDFQFADVGPALAGLIMRDLSGNPRAGIFSSRPDLVRGRAGEWSLDVSAFVAARRKDKAVLLGGTDIDLNVPVSPAPAANARIDVAYTLPADVDAGDPIRAIAVQQGVASAVPSKPAIPAGAIEVATARISAGSTGTAQATITNTFPYACAAGGILIVRTTAELDAFPAHDGTRAFCLADQSDYTRINGFWVGHGRAGVMTQGAGPWAVTYGEIRGRIVTFDVPVTINNSRQRLAITPLSTGSGYGGAEVASIGTSSGGVTRVNMRHTQVGSDQQQALTIMWQVVALR